MTRLATHLVKTWKFVLWYPFFISNPVLRLIIGRKNTILSASRAKLIANKGEFSNTMLQSPNLQKTFIIAKNMIQNTKSRDINLYQSTRPTINPGHKSEDPGARPARRFCRIHQLVLTISAKFRFDHRCIGFIMTNLHADRTKSPYYKMICFASFSQYNGAQFLILL